MKIINSEKLKEIEIETSLTGFTVWITEVINGNKIKHWLLDGSLLKKNGIINLGRTEGMNYKYEALYNRKEKAIYLRQVRQ